MALFGAPIAHEDQPGAPSLAALAFRAVTRPAAAAEPARAVTLRVRIGLHTGLVVVGRVGDNLRMDYTAIGDTTNSRRAAAAGRARAILLSEATERLIWLPTSSCSALGTFVGGQEPGAAGRRGTRSAVRGCGVSRLTARASQGA